MASADQLSLVIPKDDHQDSFFYATGKRVFDIIIASFAILVFSPLMAVLALLIVLEDKGPVLYRQTRVGRYGVSIPFLKFRSMWVDADRMRDALFAQSDAQGAAFKMKNDPRVTKVGRIIRKLSLDELPQLFSVLKGDMSVIGPRPHLLSEVMTYQDNQFRRLWVKPGLLCFREVKGRSDLSFDEWLALDLEYIENRSLWLDIKILFMAVPAILRGTGAY